MLFIRLEEVRFDIVGERGTRYQPTEGYDSDDCHNCHPGKFLVICIHAEKAIGQRKPAEQWMRVDVCGYVLTVRAFAVKNGVMLMLALAIGPKTIVALIIFVAVLALVSR